LGLADGWLHVMRDDIRRAVAARPDFLLMPTARVEKHF